MNVRILVPAILLLCACARSEDATVNGNTNQLQPVERVHTSNSDEEEIAIGEWRETLQDDNGALEFGPRGVTPLFSFRCEARHAVALQRHGVVETGDLPTMLVSVGSETRRLAVTSVDGAVPMLRASLAPNDPFIATLSDAAEPIVVRIGETPPLALPTSPSIGAFLERCETGAAPVTELPAAANAAAPANEAAPAPAGH